MFNQENGKGKSLTTKKRQPIQVVFFLPGNVLLSQGRMSQLPSALRSLTSVFGMGTGVTFSPLLPDYV